MRKFECKECDKNCIVYCDGGKSPTCCIDCYDSVDWHEVKEVVTDCNQLPKLTAEVFDRPDCPEWAKYAFVNEDGLGYWYEENPGLFYTGRGHGSKVKLIGCFNDCINTLIERPATEELPDWCKAGKWIYYNVIGEYAIVKKEENQQWYIDNLKTLSPARKRQFNEKEMRGLVGKVFTTPDGDVSIATDFDNIMNSICICSEWFKGDELANSIWQLDGKPCYKLEHLENGEWVE